MKYIFFLILLIPLNVSAQIDFEKIKSDYQITGSVTLYDLKEDHWIFSDEQDSKTGTLPASTFKIMNSLIALETGVVKDEHELIKWVGIQNVDTVYYGYRPDIYKDMDLTEALAKSAVWVHLELAKKIGREKYKHYLTKCNYGNLDFSEKGIDFWNFGSFAITPVEQIKFIKKLYEGKLPFSKRTMDIVKKIMLTETGKDYQIRAKTGMGVKPGETFGWWVGYVERNNNVYFFATRIRTVSYSMEFAQKRKDVTKAVLKQLHVLE